MIDAASSPTFDPDDLLDELDDAVAAAESARKALDSAIAKRDAAIARVHSHGLMGYRRLAERSSLSVPRIQQIVARSNPGQPANPRRGPVIMACPNCGADVVSLGINERLCESCGWNWSGE